MATNEGFDEDPLSCGGYSQLMDSDIGESFIYSPPPPNFHSTKPPTMLCFGNVNKEERGFFEGGKVTLKSGITGSDSSSASSSNNSSSSNSFTKSKRGQIEEPKKTEQEEIRNGLGSKPNQVPLSASGTISGSRRTCNKKPKKENPTSSGPVKVRKEKLGERITALQQLVSPFGKTDTASVLHEAMGYIRFLHDQVQVLSSPYLQKRPSSFHLPEDGRRRGEEEEEQEEEEEGNESSDLRSRGLCLVPVEYTVHVANCNGADLWSPAAMGISNSS